MQSNNPVFSRNKEFNGRGAAEAYAADPTQWATDYANGTGVPVRSGLMTLDSVVEKTAITLGIVILTSAISWFAIGDIVDSYGYVNSDAMLVAGGLAMVGAFVGFILSLVNSFKKIISPALVIGYAVFEGLFVGAFSKVVASYVGDAFIVGQAVFATMFAFAATLAAYKFFNIRVTPKFRRVVIISMFAFVGVMLVNMVLSLFGVVTNGGLAGFSALGAVVAGIAVVLAVFMLILDFDYVERGVAARLPERESWRAAFGLTVTLIWMYIEMLRLLAILRR